jgi:hypothetical protein
MAGRVTIDQFKSQLGRPSLTSKYYLELAIPRNDGEFRSLLQKRGIQLAATDQSNLNLYCSEASLPGSSLALIDIASDRTGVTERHAHRRVFDDRIDFTFYVDGNNYLAIKFFESWIDFISGAATSDDNEQETETYHYRMNYVDDYSCSGLKITKFESDTYTKTGNSLTYNFIKAFPIAINSMPVSYDSSQLLKCTVSMTYIRYTLTPTKAAASPESKNKPQPQIPDDFSFNPNLNLGYDVPKLNTDFSKKVFDANPSFPVDFSRTDLPSFL